MTLFADDDLTCDAFLGGKLTLYQPRHGYRAGIDAVLLSASIQAKNGDRVLELGCGVGTAILCLGARVAGLHLTGVERETGFADLARRNGGAALEVVTADLTDLPLTLRQQQFDHVLANPPFYDRSASVSSDDPAREAAHGAETPLASWVKIAAKRLSPKGQAHFFTASRPCLTCCVRCRMILAPSKCCRLPRARAVRRTGLSCAPEKTAVQTSACTRL